MQTQWIRSTLLVGWLLLSQLGGLRSVHADDGMPPHDRSRVDQATAAATAKQWLAAVLAKQNPTRFVQLTALPFWQNRAGTGLCAKPAQFSDTKSLLRLLQCLSKDSALQAGLLDKLNEARVEPRTLAQITEWEEDVVKQHFKALHGAIFIELSFVDNAGLSLVCAFAVQVPSSSPAGKVSALSCRASQLE